MRLEDMNEGSSGVVKSLIGDELLMKRLQAMGLRKGKRVEVLKKLGRSILLKVDNSRLVITRDIAKGIEVQ